MDLLELSQISRERLNASERLIAQISDQYDRLDTRITISAYGRYFQLGRVSDRCFVVDLGASSVVIDQEDASAYQLRSDGSVLLVDIEDYKWQLLSDRLVFYSDSGLFIFAGTTARRVRFIALTDYWITIDFEHITNGLVRFELGSSVIVERSIVDLDAEIGEDIPACHIKYTRSSVPLVVHRVSV